MTQIFNEATEIKGTATINGTVSETPLSTWVSSNVTITTGGGTNHYLVPGTEQTGRRTLVIFNGSDSDVYIGADGVTSATGIKIPSGQSLSIDASAGVYVAAATGVDGKVISVLEGK